MQCPLDGTTLTMSERSGIEIDYCPQCRGVWLDRGELDKLVERSLGQPPPPTPAPPTAPAGSYERERDERRQRYDQRYADAYNQPYRRKRKESWLSEIFD